MQKEDGGWKYWAAVIGLAAFAIYSFSPVFNAKASPVVVSRK